jgi:hypothetical protein
VVGEIISAIDAGFRHKNAAVAAGAPRETLPMAAEAGLRVTGFRALAADFEHHNIEHQEDERRSAAEQRHHRVKELIDHHVTDESWCSTLHDAREAAAHGEKESMLLRSRLIFAPTAAGRSTHRCQTGRRPCAARPPRFICAGNAI